LAAAHKKLAIIYSRIAGTTLPRIQTRGLHYREPRDPKAPKRPMTSYLLFCSKVRDEYNKTNPGINSKEMASILGHAWRALDDSSRKKYEAEAQALKKKFDSDMTKFKNGTYKAGAANDASSSEEDSSDDSEESEESDTPAPAPVKAKPKPRAKAKAATPAASTQPAATAAAAPSAEPKKASKKPRPATTDEPSSAENSSSQEAAAAVPRVTSPEKKKHRKHKSDANANGVDGTHTKKKVKKTK
ncbi:high mobility group box 3, partial [Coemansia sp. RSA 2599]